MSGGEVVSSRGGIDVRTDDLRAAAHIMSGLGLTLRQDMDELRARTAGLASLMYDRNGVRSEVESGSLARAGGAADEAVRLSHSLWSTADSYDEGESRVERLAGEAVALTKNATKRYVRVMSGGLLDTPWAWDPRTSQTLAAALDLTRIDAIVAGIAVVLDWRRPPLVLSTGVDRSPAGTAPPRSTADLLDGVQRLESNGASDISVQFLEFADGRPRQVIVSLPGTSQWAPGTDVPTDLTAGILAITGLPTAYSAGVVEILGLAGVTAADQILMVGHSLGGIVAAQLASDLSRSGLYSVTNVVTAGSPIAKIDIPDDVDVIALENKNDPVPYLDPGPNEQSGNVITITVDTGEIGTDAHVIGSGYAPAADAVDQSSSPPIQHALEGLTGFLNADRTTTYTYSITRG